MISEHVMSPNIELEEEKDNDNIAKQSVKASLKTILDRPPNLLFHLYN